MKSPTKVAFSFKWKNIKSSHSRNIYLLEKLRSDHLRSNHLRIKFEKKNFFVHSVKM